MADDTDWVADVRRWVSSQQSNPRPSAELPEAPELGYEAAHPALQARHWPDAPASAVTLN